MFPGVLRDLVLPTLVDLGSSRLLDNSAAVTKRGEGLLSLVIPCSRSALAVAMVFLPFARMVSTSNCLFDGASSCTEVLRLELECEHRNIGVTVSTIKTGLHRKRDAGCAS